MAGFANGICRKVGGVAFVGASMHDLHGTPRFRQSYHALAHELGHLLGAKHDKRRKSLMHPHMLSFIDNKIKRLRMFPKARREIRKCVRLEKWSER